MRRNRALLIALGILVVTLAAYDLRQRGSIGLPWFPGCPFRKITGLLCPGCGMTRAAYATLHGDLPRAFRMNPLGMTLMPIALFGLALEGIGWVRNRPPPFRLNVGPKIAWGIAILMIAFWVLRNLPWWPFTLLAPH